MSRSTSSFVEDHIAITRVLTNMAYAEDTLDWALFESSWTSTHPLQIDLSSHLSQYSPDLQITAADLARTAHLQLSGFDGTQHILSNFMIDVDPASGDTAYAVAYVTAYHAYKRPAEEGPSSVLVRGTWNVSLVKEADEQWRAVGIKVNRMLAAEGDESLYELAKQKGESGHGRKALTLWKE